MITVVRRERTDEVKGIYLMYSSIHMRRIVIPSRY